MNAVSLGRFLRTQNNLKVRQPLARALLVAPDAETEEMLRKTAGIIAEELNVKAVEFEADEGALVKRSAKANFKVLGAKLGKNMKDGAAQIAKFSDAEVASIAKGNLISISFADGSSAEITADDLIIQREQKPGMTVATENGITIALDTNLNDDLIAEGFAREFVSKIQNLRKESGFDVADRITISYKHCASDNAVARFNDYIASETLAEKIVICDSIADAVTLDINGENVEVKVEKI